MKLFQRNREKTGIIDVGGGLRGIFGAGVLDYCLDKNITFDYCCGVSAGAANMVTFLAGQIGRNYPFYTEFAFRDESMSLRDYALTGSYLNLDYIYGELSSSHGEYPLDYEHFRKNPAELVIVATDAETGDPVYFSKDDLSLDDYKPVMASSCVPGICEPYPIGDKSYFDGGLSDPIPVDRALEDGCTKLVLILTKPEDTTIYSNKERFLADMMIRKYPEISSRLRWRYRLYDRQLRRAKELEREGRLLIVAPSEIGGLKTLTRDLDELKQLYRRGLVQGPRIRRFLQKK